MRYFTEIFSNEGRPGASSTSGGGDARGIQHDPTVFVDSWLEPYGNALKGLLQPWEHLFILKKAGHKKAGDMSSVIKLVQKARNAVLELLHVPHDEWRTVVLAAINLVRQHVIVDGVVCVRQGAVVIAVCLSGVLGQAPHVT